jgi:Leu/Phe-tRNA-protein transferase
LLDAQVASPHLLRLGAQEMPRQEFINLMSAAVAAPEVNRQQIFDSTACLSGMQKI